MYLLLLPTRNLPTPRLKKAPDSPVPGASSASGKLPPFRVPAVTSPKLADNAAKLVTSILFAEIVPAVISSAFNSPRRVIVPAD